jgi:hypothetical protein
VTPPPVAQPPLTRPAEPEPEPREPAPPPPPAARPAEDWDPRRDLLPYHDADELEDKPPVAGLAWLAWVAAAVVLLGLAFVLMRTFATDVTDDDDATASEAASETSTPDGAAQPEESPEGPEGPTGVGKRVDLARLASYQVPATAPPTTDLDGNLVAYEAGQMGDGLPTTAWRMAGDGTGSTVTITLPRPSVVDRVGLVNGYSKQVAGVDWYPNNRRILAVTWGFEDGTTLDQTFAERPGMQMLKVPPVQTSTVTITISSVTPPGSGNLGRDYTAISEVRVMGRRAG